VKLYTLLEAWLLNIQCGGGACKRNAVVIKRAFFCNYIIPLLKFIESKQETFNLLACDILWHPSF
jgi:hypothetical protein